MHEGLCSDGKHTLCMQVQTAKQEELQRIESHLDTLKSAERSLSSAAAKAQVSRHGKADVHHGGQAGVGHLCGIKVLWSKVGAQPLLAQLQSSDCKTG